MIKRILEEKLKEALLLSPSVAILGPRQVGKTTLAFELAKTYPNSLYLDLESPKDKAKLQNPELYLYDHRDKLIILDEIQRLPSLFLVLRGLIDRYKRENNQKAKFLILGSCSLDLIKQSSESLAGRIRYLELSTLLASEISVRYDIKRLWFRGGFPLSFLATNEKASALWRESFIKTYLERDIPQLGLSIPSTNLYRLWIMLAHLQGTNINKQQLAANLNLSNMTIKRYIDLFCDLLLIRQLEPFFINTKKRIIKTPRIYLRDSGLLHQLLGIHSTDALLTHPIIGKSYEGFVIENIITCLPSLAQAYYYRSSGGSEIDLVIDFPNQQRWAIEIKNNSTPKIPKGFYYACDDIKATKRFLVYQGEETYRIDKKITVISLVGLIKVLLQS